MSSITYLEAIRLAQHRALTEDPRVFIYGQDIGGFGGAFKATKNLAKEFPGRVLDAPISEDAMMGLAIGARAPFEIGLSVVAEVVAALRAREALRTWQTGPSAEARRAMA